MVEETRLRYGCVPDSRRVAGNRYRRRNLLRKEANMKLVYAYIAIMFVGIGCMKREFNEARFTEPIRSQMMIQSLMGGVPITLALCWEQKLIEQGIDHPMKISKDAFKKAQKACEQTVAPQIKKEIEEEMAREQAAEAI
jgi:hypothetical protein